MKDIVIIEIINGEFAVSPEDGDSVYELIKQSLEKEEAISLDFRGIDIMTTAFLNNAIGKLYKNFNKDSLNKYISMKNISTSDLELIKKVIERAKITFNEDTIDSIQEAFEDE